MGDYLRRMIRFSVAGLPFQKQRSILTRPEAPRLAAAEPAWEGKTILLARAGVQLQAPEGQDIAPKTAGVAKDLTFRVKKEEKDRLLLDSRRQHGWAAKADAVPFDQAVAFSFPQPSA